MWFVSIWRLAAIAIATEIRNDQNITICELAEAARAHIEILEPGSAGKIVLIC